jgi:CRISPR system Cascade subunit CasD
MKSALERPAFVPYVGRKAHALMLPMRPRLVSADGIVAAFSAFDEGITSPVQDIMNMARDARHDHRPLIFVDADAAEGLLVERLEQRRDIPESRDKWRFGMRAEALLRQPPASGDQQ